jgi:hypothetical protein
MPRLQKIKSWILMKISSRQMAWCISIAEKGIVYGGRYRQEQAAVNFQERYLATTTTPVLSNLRGRLTSWNLPMMPDLTASGFGSGNIQRWNV